MNNTAQSLVQRGRVTTRVLATLLVAGRRGNAGLVPDFTLLDSLLGYVDRTVRGAHYAAEESGIARKLEVLEPGIRADLARLRRDHIGTEGYTYRMGEALGHWKKGWPRGADAYLENARDLLRLGADHRKLMERTILPAAEVALSPSQWQELGAALARGPGDLLAGCRTRRQFEGAICRHLGRTGPHFPIPSPPRSPAAQTRRL